jgi:hypothetical protein
MREALPLADAARHLGITPAALHKRIRRKSIDAYKTPDNRWMVWVDTDQDADSGQRVEAGRTEPEMSWTIEAAVQAVTEVYIRLADEQLATIQHLREESERKDVIIMQLTNRLTALPAPTEPEPSSEPVPREPWWKRWFG